MRHEDRDHRRRLEHCGPQGHPLVSDQDADVTLLAALDMADQDAAADGRVAPGRPLAVRDRLAEGAAMRRRQVWQALRRAEHATVTPIEPPLPPPPAPPPAPESV